MSGLSVEGTIKLNLGGTPWDWLVVHQGLPSAIYDVSCDGTWLLLKDCYANRAWNNTAMNNLETSAIHSYLNDGFLQLFDPKIQNAIKQVKVPYRTYTGKNNLSTKVFLLSGCEVGWTTDDSNSYTREDGVKLDYFVTSTAGNSKRIAYLNGTADYWWSRSPWFDGEGDGALCVLANGRCAYSYVGSKNGVRPAIILPSDMLVTDDMLAA